MGIGDVRFGSTERREFPNNHVKRAETTAPSFLVGQDSTRMSSSQAVPAKK